MDRQPLSSGSQSSTNSAFESEDSHLPHVSFLHVYVCTRLLRATADDAWLSKQLKNGSSWPRTSEAADGGKHAYPESGLQISENVLEGGASRDLQAAETRLAAHIKVLTLTQLARSRSPKMPCIRLLVYDEAWPLSPPPHQEGFRWFVGGGDQGVRWLVGGGDRGVRWLVGG